MFTQSIFRFYYLYFILTKFKRNIKCRIKSWVQWAIHYKIENYNENIELDDILERPSL